MKIFRIALLVLFFIITFGVVSLAPKLHKQVRLEAPDFSAEEIVAWNAWYSNVSNELLNTVKFPEQEVATLKNVYVKFDVDKDGTVENISTRTTPADDYEIAEKYVIPAIEGLSGKPILKFPTGSKKKVTTFTSIFVPSAKTQYTTPEDFQDLKEVNQR